MVKKIKKPPRSGHKDKRGSTHNEEKISENTGTVEHNAVQKARKGCPHLDKGIDLAKFTWKLSFVEHVRCEDCRENVTERRTNKGKAKTESGSTKATWVCLQCGHFSCGGIGFPTISQSHAVRHANQTRHNLAIQYENPQLRWCFPCGTLIPVEKIGENDEFDDPLSDIVKLVKARSTKKVSVIIEDIWFGDGGILREKKSQNTGYLVRGLVNLGNTCFFNSIMQNLLALDRLRDHYLELNESAGPLNAFLKKIFLETISDSGLKYLVNPRSFFDCVCAKAPQFRGYQQHDSHELLRFLLDGLCTEELNADKQIYQGSTFIDAMFGGQLSSTVSCLECGHSSKVFEPFLDLSIPVPPKKPLSKKVNQPISLTKKQKLPPERNTWYLPIVNGAASFHIEYTEPVETKAGEAMNNSMGQSMVSETKSASSTYQMVTESIEAKPFVGNVTDDFSWLDDLEPDIESNDGDTTLKRDDIAASHDAGEKDHGVEGLESSSQILNFTVTTTGSSENLSRLDFIEPNEVLNGYETVSEFDDYLVNLDIGDEINQLVSTAPSIYADSNCSSPGYSFENEQPLQVQSSEVIFLPYKKENFSSGEISTGEEEVCSSAFGCEPDSFGFYGLFDLFSELNLSEDTSVKPIASESDPDEVDNSNSQVSVESCLAYFTKSEFLSTSEHGWICENCSEAIQEQKRESKKTHEKTADEIDQNEAVNRFYNRLSGSDQDSLCLSIVQNTSCGDITKEIDSLKVDDDYTTSEKIDPVFEESNIQEIIGHTQPVEENVSAISSDVYSANEVHMLGKGFESEESGDEETNHESTKVKRDATKRILINKVPSILTIHLKRFSQDARGRLSKLNGHVDFNDTLDLRPYMDPWSNATEECMYRLSGVVEHRGMMKSGHYVAYIRGSKKSQIGDNSVWYHASDASVRQVSLQEVLQCEAYILFYEKI